MTWDEASLEHGYVLDRIASGGWWHLHFGRSRWSYHCDMLGHQTKILAVLQRFEAGAVSASPPYFLTLDGEGVELSASEVSLDFCWGDRFADTELADEARNFQREVVPLLHDSPTFQRSLAEVVALQQHRQVVAPGTLRRD